MVIYIHPMSSFGSLCFLANNRNINSDSRRLRFLWARFRYRVRSQLYESTPGELIRRLNALAEEKVERVQQFFAKSQGDVLEVEWTDFLFSEASKYAALRCFARTLF